LGNKTGREGSNGEMKKETGCAEGGGEATGRWSHESGSFYLPSFFFFTSYFLE
jgi:hypothetical protein